MKIDYEQLARFLLEDLINEMSLEDVEYFVERANRKDLQTLFDIMENERRAKAEKNYKKLSKKLEWINDLSAKDKLIVLSILEDNEIL